MERGLSFFVLTLLAIEFLDEFVFGAQETAWPLIRTDLGLSYAQVGMLLGLPGVVGNLVEPVIGILGDVWRRRFLILRGGVVFTLALSLTALSKSFPVLLISFVLFFPASGAFVSLSQATLMDADPTCHEQNMARWTFAGSAGATVYFLPSTAYNSSSAARIRSRAAVRVARGQPKFKRTNPSPPGPNAAPSFNATRARSRKNWQGSPGMPASRQSSHARKVPSNRWHVTPGMWVATVSTTQSRFASR